MRIPKKFKLRGRTVRVEYDERLQFTRDCDGEAHFGDDKIILQPSRMQTPYTSEHVEHVFLHEFTHFILKYAGEDYFDPPLHDREMLVDRIAGLLHQAIQTAEY